MRDKIGANHTDLRTLVELSALINSSLGIHDVLENSMTCVQEFMNAEASAIFELDSPRGELFFRTALGRAAKRVSRVRLKLGEGVAGWVAQTGNPVIVADTKRDSRFRGWVDEKTGFETRSILCAPMRRKGQIVGVLEVLNKRGSESFDEKDLEMLTILASHIAIALENAKLYERLHERLVLTVEELKSTHEKLVRSERLAALGKLSQGVAHEVRNPAMVIGGFARRLQKRYVSDIEMQKPLEIILGEAERLERMVGDIETFCRLPEPLLGLVRPHEVVEKALAAVRESAQARGIRIGRNIPEDAPPIHADRELLSLALRNVLLNAVEALSEGGAVEITVRVESEAVVFAVRDSGVGIAAEDLPNVFDPFFTSKTRGSGLGLTTVHRIVSDHSGSVTIDSVRGEGTEVRMILPRGSSKPVPDLRGNEP